MNFLVSQNHMIYIVMQNIVALRIYKETVQSFNGGNSILEKNYLYDIQVSCDGYTFIDVAGYKTESNAKDILYDLIDRVRKGSDYTLPSSSHFKEE